MTTASTVYCGHCGAANAASTGFCGRCGTALRAAAGAASSVGVRCARCGAANATGARFCGACAHPLAVGAAMAPVTPAGAPPVMAVYAPASPAQYAAATPSKTGRPVPWALVAGGVGLAMLALAVIAFLLRPGPIPQKRCPPDCTLPPVNSPPLAAPHAYTSTTYGYSLEYGDVEPSAKDDKSIGWQLHTKGTSFVSPNTFTGGPANGRSAQQIVEEIQRSKFADAKLLYTIPQAEMGYWPGYGNIYQVTISPAQGEAFEGRLIIIAAVKKDLAIQLISLSPFRKTTPRDGHPNPAQTAIVDFFDGIVNTVTWPGDPPL